jgi:hypothetical protein
LRSLGVNGNYPDWKPGSTNLFARINLPVVLDNYRGTQPQPTATPGPTATPRPTTVPSPTPGTTPQLKNGNFDKGPNGDWLEQVDEQDTPGSIILKPGNAISPRSGQYVAWLGGLNGEAHAISQEVILAAPAPLYLRYWYQVRSGETAGCEFDQVGVFIEETLIVTYNLCEAEETSQWTKGSIELSDYAGDTITITFIGLFDDSVISSFFLDDVAISTTP